MDYLDDESIDDDDDDDDDVEDEETSAQLREQYARTHGLRRHTIGRPDLLVHGGPIPNLAAKVRFAHQLTSIEPTMLANRLSSLQQQKTNEPICKTTTVTDNNNNNNEDDDDENEKDLIKRYSQSFSNYYQPNRSCSNVLSGQSPEINIISNGTDQQQVDNQFLSPPISNSYRMNFINKQIKRNTYFNCKYLDMNRRASDSGAHLLSFQQQYGVTGSNTFGAVRPTTHIQSPSSNVKIHNNNYYYSSIVLFLFLAIFSWKYNSWCTYNTTNVFYNSSRSRRR